MKQTKEQIIIENDRLRRELAETHSKLFSLQRQHDDSLRKLSDDNKLHYTQIVWGEYRGVNFEIKQYPETLGGYHGNNRRWRWCAYLYFFSGQTVKYPDIFKPIAHETEYRTYYDLPKYDAQDDMNGGITFTEVTDKYIKIGWDYQHLWDYDRGCDYPPNYIFSEIKKSIDNLYEKYPEFIPLGELNCRPN